MWSLFKDKNEINEKNIVGFASFVVMVLFAVADLLTSFLFVDGKLVTEGEKVFIGGDNYKVYCRKHYRKITGLI